jgi:predicted ester cyclase
MSAEENRTLVAGWLRAAEQADFIQMLIAESAPHVVVHSPFGLRGGQNLAQEMHVQLARAFPDMTLTLDGEVYDQDRVALQFTLDGTNTGPILGLPPTGRGVTMPIALVCRIEENRIAEMWFYANLMAPIIQQRLSEMGLL